MRTPWSPPLARWALDMQVHGQHARILSSDPKLLVPTLPYTPPVGAPPDVVD